MEKIIELLKKHGWVASGIIKNPIGAIRIPGNRFVAKGYSYRYRFKYGEVARCTVGARTVCFFDVIKGKGPSNFRNYRTKDEPGILNEITQQAAQKVRQ